MDDGGAVIGRTVERFHEESLLVDDGGAGMARTVERFHEESLTSVENGGRTLKRQTTETHGGGGGSPLRVVAGCAGAEITWMTASVFGSKRDRWG